MLNPFFQTTEKRGSHFKTRQAAKAVKTPNILWANHHHLDKSITFPGKYHPTSQYHNTSIEIENVLSYLTLLTTTPELPSITIQATDHYFLRREGRVGQFQKKKYTANTEKKLSGERIAQVLSTIQVLCLTLKKILAQAIAHQKNHAQPKGEKNFSPAENYLNSPTSPFLKKIRVCPWRWFPRIIPPLENKGVYDTKYTRST